MEVISVGSAGIPEDQFRSSHCEHFKVASRSRILLRKSQKSHKAIKTSLG